jgi:hypothetical protein
MAVRGSDNSVRLEDLQRILQASHSAIKSSRVPEPPFDGVILGRNYRKDEASGYNPKPPGNWTVIKLFLSKGGDDGEVFLNINPVEGKGEFSIRDSDYGDYVRSAFARVR